MPQRGLFLNTKIFLKTLVQTSFREAKTLRLRDKTQTNQIQVRKYCNCISQVELLNPALQFLMVRIFSFSLMWVVYFIWFWCPGDLWCLFDTISSFQTFRQKALHQANRFQMLLRTISNLHSVVRFGILGQRNAGFDSAVQRTLPCLLQHRDLLQNSRNTLFY